MRISELQKLPALETNFGSHAVRSKLSTLPILKTVFGSHSSSNTDNANIDEAKWTIPEIPGSLQFDDDDDYQKYVDKLPGPNYFDEVDDGYLKVAFPNGPKDLEDDDNLWDEDYPPFNIKKHKIHHYGQRGSAYHSQIHNKVAHHPLANHSSRKKHRLHIEYHTEDSHSLNDYLHELAAGNSKNNNQHVQDKIKHIDEFILDVKLPESITVYTGVKQSPEKIWTKLNLPYNKPVRVHLPAYTSSSTAFGSAVGFASPKYPALNIKLHPPVNLNKIPKDLLDKLNDTNDIGHRHVLKLILPQGSHAVSVRNHSEFKLEHEILIMRGAVVDIDPNPELGPYSSVIWTATLVEHAHSKI